MGLSAPHLPSPPPFSLRGRWRFWSSDARGIAVQSTIHRGQAPSVPKSNVASRKKAMPEVRLAEDLCEVWGAQCVQCAVITVQELAVARMVDGRRGI